MLLYPGRSFASPYFVHVNESYKHFFTYDDSFLHYEAQETDGEIVPLERPESFELTGVKRMEAVGNALIAFAEDSMHYLFISMALTGF